jgi:hypothetical protein
MHNLISFAQTHGGEGKRRAEGEAGESEKLCRFSSIYTSEAGGECGNNAFWMNTGKFFFHVEVEWVEGNANF